MACDPLPPIPQLMFPLSKGQRLPNDLSKFFNRQISEYLPLKPMFNLIKLYTKIDRFTPILYKEFVLRKAQDYKKYLAVLAI